MNKTDTHKDLRDKSVLVTGANSGLGYEAAAQLAESGYGRIILACRTLEKATAAQRSLVEKVGSDPFDTLAVDVSSVESAGAAAEELIKRGRPIDALLLNAGMVSGDDMHKSVDGLELAFASSIVGHHVLTLRLLEADLLSTGARIVIAGSEAARNDLPAMMGSKLYDFATEAPGEFGSNLPEAMINFIKGAKPERFVPMRYYATTKVFTSWWTAAMARKYGDRISAFTVSPGANMGTNAARHVTGFKKFLFTKFMPTVGKWMGMNQPTSQGAKRYVDVILGVGGDYGNGRTYMSKEKKMVGPLFEMKYDHLLDEERQETAWRVIRELTGTPAEVRSRSVPA